ncbi:MAG: DUF134 domain-containing protein [Methanoregula sp.]|jgi:hypothetical protein|nr:DUF134 domain-containing protein [Methanoregula sp.]
MNRSLDGGPAGQCYAPQCNTGGQDEEVLLLPQEIAALNLIDLQNLEQEVVAGILGVSRKTVWRDIHEARHKIADALLNGKTIRMEGCTRRLNGHCPKRDKTIYKKSGGGRCHGGAVVQDRDPGESA